MRESYFDSRQRSPSQKQKIVTFTHPRHTGLAGTALLDNLNIITSTLVPFAASLTRRQRGCG